jgi:tRNA(fMet)-specific endonuclease VapC
MKYLLDTNTCIYFLNSDANIVEKIENLPESELAISIITLAELQFGAYNSGNVHRNLKRIAFLTASIPVLNLTPIITDCYGKLRTSLRKTGQTVDDFDILIGATAIVGNLILVTNNERHFEHMNEIVLENWMKR